MTARRKKDEEAEREWWERFKAYCPAEQAAYWRDERMAEHYALMRGARRLGFVAIPDSATKRVHLRCAGCLHGRMWWTARLDRYFGYAHKCELCGYVEWICEETYPHYWHPLSGHRHQVRCKDAP